jgi:hypothetical protein
MSNCTRFLSRLIGLYCLLAALSMLVRRETMIDTVTALVTDAPLLYFVGVILLAAGLAMVLTHNVWSGGALAVTVTLIAWLTLLKGLVMLLLPPAAVAQLYLHQLHYERLFYLYVAVTTLLGVWLTLGGFRSRSPL